MKVHIAALAIVLAATGLAGCGSPDPVRMSEHHTKKCVMQFNELARKGLLDAFLDPATIPEDCELMVQVVANPANGREWEQKQLALTNRMRLIGIAMDKTEWP